MAEDTPRPIVIKRKKRAHAAHHGGAWKIAYADFVTAMMAFFLLMWLLGSTTKGQLEGIAQFFQSPLKVAMSGGNGSGDSTSTIKIGGMDLTRADDQQSKRGNVRDQKRLINVRQTKLDLEREAQQRQDQAKIAKLKEDVEQVINASPLLQQYKNQLLIDMTSEGLRIQIVDDQNRPMFDIGSSQLKPYARDILLALSKPLNEVDNKITLTGHTDAKPYPSGERGYSNWELSSDRANASRRVLVSGGISEGKIKRVEGMSSAVLFDAKNPDNPNNRRIAIIVLTKQAEADMDKVSGAVTATAGVVTEASNER